MANFDRERVAAAAFFESFGLTRHDEAIDTLAAMLRQTRDSERDRIVSIVKACDPDTVYVSAGDGEECAGGVDMEQARGWILDRIEGKP